MQTNLNNSFQKSEIGLRIKVLISALGMNQSTFAELLEISAGRLSNVLTGRNKPDSEFLEKIARVFRGQINTNWLLTGEGEPILRNVNILRSQNDNVVIKSSNDVSNDTKTEESVLLFGQSQVNEPASQYQTISAAHKMEIERLKIELGTLKERLRDKEERILELKEHIQTLKNAKFPAQMPVLEHTTP